MSRRSSLRFPAAAGLLALACLGWSSPPPSAGEALVGEKDVMVTLQITDRTAGFSLEAKKLVAADSNAFDFVRRSVAVAYQTGAESSPVVASPCGVPAKRGHARACPADGKPCKPVGNVTLKADVIIEWKAEETGGSDVDPPQA